MHNEQTPNQVAHMSRRVRFICALGVGLVVFALPAVVHQLNILKVQSFPFGYYFTAHAGAVLCAALAWFGVSRQTRILPPPSFAPVLSGLALSMAGLGIPLVFGLTGVVYRFGYDGLALGLGWVAGLVLLTLWSAPLLLTNRARSLPGLLGQRLESPTAGLLALIATGVVTCGLMAMVLVAAADIGAVVPGLSRLSVIAVVALGVGVIALILPSSIVRMGLLACAFVTFVAFVIMAAWICASELGAVVPHFDYGTILETIAGLERQALISGDADPVTFKLHLRPEVHYSSINFAALTLCLMLGTAVMPHILSATAIFSGSGSEATISEVTSRSEPGFWTGAWAVVFVMAIAITAPVLAALAKLVIFRDVIGQNVSDLPAWLFSTPFNIHVAEICGRPAESLSAVASACAAIPDHQGIVRFDDLTISLAQVSGVLLASTNAPFWLWCLYGGGVVTAIVAMGALLVLALKIAFEDYLIVREMTSSTGAPLSQDVGEKTDWVAQLQLYLCVWLLVAAAAWLAYAYQGAMTAIIVGSFSIAAGSIFPVVLLITFWSRVKPLPVIVGMACGLTAGLIYLFGPLLAPVEFFHLTMPMSNASAYAIEDYHELLSLWQTSGRDKSSDAWTALYAHAQPLANWFGLQPGAAGVIGLVCATVAIVLTAPFVVVLRERETTQ